MRTTCVARRVGADDDFLEVQDDVGDVFDDVGHRGELVQRAVDLDGGDRRALQRRQQHAAQRVAERDAEAALERLAHEAPYVVDSVSCSTDSDFGRIRSRQLRATICEVLMLSLPAEL